MSQKIVWGLVNADGTKKAGSGYTPVHDDKGEYTIVFDPGTFSGMPCVVTTQNYPEWGNFDSDGGNTQDNTVLIAVSSEKFKAKAGNSSGGASDRNFTFIAIGNCNE